MLTSGTACLRYRFIQNQWCPATLANCSRQSPPVLRLCTPKNHFFSVALPFGFILEAESGTAAICRIAARAVISEEGSIRIQDCAFSPNCCQPAIRGFDVVVAIVPSSQRGVPSLTDAEQCALDCCTHLISSRLLSHGAGVSSIDVAHSGRWKVSRRLAC